jgi:hypothetical protein
MRGSLLLFLVVCACTTFNASSLDGACGRYYDAYDRFVRSCLIADSAIRVLGTRESFVRACRINQSAPGIGANAGFLVRCAAALEWRAPECPELSLASVPECVLPAGSLLKGSECVLSAQCESRNCKTGTKADGGAPALSACGVCGDNIGAPSAPAATAMEPGVEGSVCEKFETYSCGPGLYCDLVYVFETGTQGGSCKRLPEFGEACTSVCARALVCLRGACQDGQTLGAACNTERPCAVGFACDSSSKKCTGPSSAGCSPGSCGIFSTCVDNRCQSIDANLCK